MLKSMRTGLLLLLLLPLLLAIDVHYVGKATVTWDPVTTLANGDPIPAGWTVEYEVFIGDPELPLGMTPLPTFTIDVEWDSHRKVGVRTVLEEADQLTVHYSEINWSDVNGEETPVPFVLVQPQGPAVPLGLELEGG